MLDKLELLYGRYNGGDTAPIGSYLNPRTMCIKQNLADSTLELCGTWCRVEATGAAAFADIATALNTALGTAYVAGSFHAYGAGDLLTAMNGVPGQMTNDA